MEETVNCTQCLRLIQYGYALRSSFGLVWTFRASLGVQCASHGCKLALNSFGCRYTIQADSPIRTSASQSILTLFVPCLCALLSNRIFAHRFSATRRLYNDCNGSFSKNGWSLATLLKSIGNCRSEIRRTEEKTVNEWIKLVGMYVHCWCLCPIIVRECKN